MDQATWESLVRLGEAKEHFKMVIHITQDDIDKGQKNSSYCPIALAIRRILSEHVEEPEFMRVNVGMHAIKVGNQWYRQSNDGQNFISRFDNGLEVKPFELILQKEII